MSHNRPAISIIVPTYREAPNIEPLVTRAFASLEGAGVPAEMVIVDDNSQDGTEAIVESLGKRFPVRCVIRTTDRGLSSAVLAGFQQARHDRFVVMDADLQHPPEMIPAIAAELDRDGCDFVLATRYAGGGKLPADWPWHRRLASRTATWLARPLAPLSDPMSGFFAMHRNTWTDAAPLDPIGFKIGLELYVKGRCRRPREVPFTFGLRPAGESKFRLVEQVRYLRHLSRLYWFRYSGLVMLFGLVLVGTIAWLVWRALD